MSEKRDIIDEYGMSEEEIEERLAEVDKDIEDYDKKVAEIKKRAPLLTKVFVQGKNYRDTELLKLKDGTFCKVLLRPLGDGDIYEAFDAVGIKNIPGTGKKVDIPPIKYARLTDKLARLSIVLPDDISEQELLENIAYGETTRIGTKLLTKLFKRDAIELGISKRMDEEAGFT